MNYGEVGTNVNYGGSNTDVGPDTGVVRCQCCSEDFMGALDSDTCDWCADGSCPPEFTGHCDGRNGHMCDGSVCNER